MNRFDRIAMKIARVTFRPGDLLMVDEIAPALRKAYTTDDGDENPEATNLFNSMAWEAVHKMSLLKGSEKIARMNRIAKRVACRG